MKHEILEKNIGLMALVMILAVHLLLRLRLCLRVHPESQANPLHVHTAVAVTIIHSAVVLLLSKLMDSISLLPAVVRLHLHGFGLGKDNAPYLD